MITFRRTAPGEEVGSFTATVPPTFDGTRALYLSGSTLQAVDQRTSTVLWSFAGDGALNTPPIAASGYVYIASSNAELYALEAAPGKAVFSMKLPRGGTQAGAPGASQGVSIVMAAGNQTLVVSTPDLLVALQAQKGPKGGAVR